jgi:D-alanyl-D-alanine carboxypeptidase
VAFLQALATRWDKFGAFEPTLAITGDPNGSLRKRMLGPLTYYKVYGKTGNLAGVSTLCGYITAQSGQRYVFSILINGGVSEGAGHAFQDRFLTELAKFG